MPSRIPSYRQFKATRQAIVVLAGKIQTEPQISNRSARSRPEAATLGADAGEEVFDAIPVVI